jgi:hypothetical protein
MRKKKIIKLLAILFFLSIFIQSCISVANISQNSGVKQNYLTKIPKGTKVIIVEKDNITADSLYEEVYTILLLRGHRIFKDDKQRHYITTEGKSVGEATLQRMTIVVSGNGDSTNLEIKTEWKPGMEATIMASAMSGIPVSSDWAIAKWEINRLGISFAESVAIANKIKNGRVSYR